jgi:hypothetical protein
MIEIIDEEAAAALEDEVREREHTAPVGTIVCAFQLCNMVLRDRGLAQFAL